MEISLRKERRNTSTRNKQTSNAEHGKQESTDSRVGHSLITRNVILLKSEGQSYCHVIQSSDIDMPVFRNCLCFLTGREPFNN